MQGGDTAVPVSPQLGWAVPTLSPATASTRHQPSAPSAPGLAAAPGPPHPQDQRKSLHCGFHCQSDHPQTNPGVEQSTSCSCCSLGTARIHLPTSARTPHLGSSFGPAGWMGVRDDLGTALGSALQAELGLGQNCSLGSGHLEHSVPAMTSLPSSPSSWEGNGFSHPFSGDDPSFLQEELGSRAAPPELEQGAAPQGCAEATGEPRLQEWGKLLQKQQERKALCHRGVVGDTGWLCSGNASASL